MGRKFASNDFRTVDLNLAAVLVSLDIPLTALERSGNTSKVEFIFSDSKSLPNVISAYWSNKLRLEPRKLLMNLKFLKNQIYSSRI